jgi:hypothetical protein
MSLAASSENSKLASSIVLVRPLYCIPLADETSDPNTFCFDEVIQISFDAALCLRSPSFVVNCQLFLSWMTVVRHVVGANTEKAIQADNTWNALGLPRGRRQAQEILCPSKRQWYAAWTAKLRTRQTRQTWRVRDELALRCIRLDCGTVLVSAQGRGSACAPYRRSSLSSMEDAIWMRF